MSYLILPKKVFNNPLIEYANFEDQSFVNLIRLNKPYANGISYAVYETTNNAFCSNGLFKTYDERIIKKKKVINITDIFQSGLIFNLNILN